MGEGAKYGLGNPLLGGDDAGDIGNKDDMKRTALIGVDDEDDPPEVGGGLGGGPNTGDLTSRSLSVGDTGPITGSLAANRIPTGGDSMN